MLRCLLLLLLLCASASARAATFVVRSVADTAGNNCGADCTLRQALRVSNQAVGADVIAFSIPGDGPHRISPTTALPTIIGPLTIDGYTQPGAAPNTLEEGSNAVIMIELDGTNLSFSGLAVCADDFTLRGLAITRFVRGVSLGRDNTLAICAQVPTDARIGGNFVGLHADGSTPGGNTIGIAVGAANSTVGGATVAERNLVAANLTGISVVQNAAEIAGNLIGTDRTSLLDRGNAIEGIAFQSSSNLGLVGGAAPNRIAFNGTGILVRDLATGTRVLANHIGPNDALGIDLVALGSAPDGVTANDPNDGDAGGNHLQNYPQDIAVTRTAGGLALSGRVDRALTLASITFTVGVHANPDCGATSEREGERFLGSFNFTSTGPGAENFSNVAFATDAPLPVGTGITLTATDPAGNTSEFSECSVLDGSSPSFTVTKTADSNDGNCNADCSLREAIVAANGNIDGNRIVFNIPGTGPHTISPTSPLPTIVNTVRIDGYTQAGALANTAPGSSNAVIMIALDGASSPVVDAGLAICASNCSVSGLSVTGFDVGISIGATSTVGFCGGGATHGNVVSGNFIGLRPDGSTAATNSDSHVLVSDSTHATIGGSVPAARNLIAGSSIGGVRLNSAPLLGTRIDGNFFGTDRSGTLDRGIGRAIATTSSTGAHEVAIGERAPNLFRFNAHALLVSGASQRISAYANHFVDSGNHGIDLIVNGTSPDGVTINDGGDADAGGNHLQNHPVIASASASGGLLTMTGSLDVPADLTGIYRLAVYESAACDISGHGEGAIYLGFVDALIGGSAESFRIRLANAPAAGRIVTMTATDDLGNTSELSTCATVVDGDLIFASRFE